MNCFAKTIFFLAAIASAVDGAPLDTSEEAAATDVATSVPNCPRIVTREEWGARKSSSAYSPMLRSPAPYVVAHHGGVPHYCYDQDTCSRIVRGYQDFHMDTHGWIDVGYHFIIGGDGNVYEGRGWDNIGAHAPGYNSQGIGICIIGDYTSHMPNNASLEAFKSLIECGISLNKVKSEYKLIGHRQGRSTECPGQTFFEYLKTWPHFELNPVPLSATLTTGSKTKLVKVAAPTVDITGSQLWTDLIALGVPEKSESSSTVSTARGTLEENVVDTGNNIVKTPSSE